jgi:hypothetical protein
MLARAEVLTMTGAISSARLIDNPFYVLEIAAECSRAEVERAGQKLLGMLELDLGGAHAYATPFGPGRRDAAKVREAMAELRDPQRRLFHELWAQSRPWTASTPIVDEAVDEHGFSAALSALGWR